MMKKNGNPSSYTNNVSMSEGQGITIDKNNIIKDALLKMGFTEDEINNMTEEYIIDLFDMEDKLDKNISSYNDCTQAELLWCTTNEYSKYLKKPEELEFLLNAELITQYPKIDGLASDKLNGLIEFKRFSIDENSNQETTKKLTYISSAEFDTKYNQYTQNGSTDIFNYFTLDAEANVVVAVWTREEGFFQTNNTALQTQKKIEPGYDEAKIKAKYDSRYTVDTNTMDLITAKYTTYSISKTKINYKSLIQQYTMPFEYLWILVVMGKDYDFVKEIAQLVYDSEIIVGVYDDTTTTVDINRKEYTENFREKYEKHEKEAAEEFRLVEERDWVEESYNYYEENKITTIYNTVQSDINYANTWIVEENIQYASKKSQSDPYESTNNEPDEEWSDNGTEVVFSEEIRTRLVPAHNRDGTLKVDPLTGEQVYDTETYTVYIREKFYREKKTTGKKNTTNLNIENDKYQKETSTVKEKTDPSSSAEPNFANIIRKSEYLNAYRLITDKKVTSWLVEVLSKNEDTTIMVNLTLYLLNKATNSSGYIDETQFSFDDIWNSIVIANTPVTAVGDDYIVDTTKSNTNIVIKDRDVLKKAIEDLYTGQAKNNLLGQLDTFLEMQNTYHVNAVFAIAVTKIESSCGTNWAAIDPSTYNWMSMTGSYNGNSYRNPNSSNPRTWRVYPSFREATLDFGDVIANGSYYFKASKYTVLEIAPTYCNLGWGEKIIAEMTKIYSAAGITTLGGEGDLTITGGIGGTENNQNGDSYTSTFTVGQRVYKNYKQPRGSDWCGITSTAIVLSGYGFNTMTPQVVYDNSTRGNIYYWRQFLYDCLGIPFKDYVRTNIRSGVINQLKQGKPVIVHVPANDGKYYTNAEHFFVILSISEDGQQFYVSDPGGYSASTGRDGWNNISDVLEFVNFYIEL